jgi:small GTP-binding protein
LLKFNSEKFEKIKNNFLKNFAMSLTILKLFASDFNSVKATENHTMKTINKYSLNSAKTPYNQKIKQEDSKGIIKRFCFGIVTILTMSYADKINKQPELEEPSESENTSVKELLEPENIFQVKPPEFILEKLLSRYQTWFEGREKQYEIIKKIRDNTASNEELRNFKIFFLEATNLAREYLRIILKGLHFTEELNSKELNQVTILNTRISLEFSNVNQLKIYSRLKICSNKYKAAEVLGDLAKPFVHISVIFEILEEIFKFSSFFVNRTKTNLCPFAIYRYHLRIVGNELVIFNGKDFCNIMEKINFKNMFSIFKNNKIFFKRLNTFYAKLNGAQGNEDVTALLNEKIFSNPSFAPSDLPNVPSSALNGQGMVTTCGECRFLTKSGVNQEFSKYRCESRIILLGKEKSGKSCLLKALLGESFEEEYVPTAGSAHKSLIFRSSTKENALLFWDISGHEKYKQDRSLEPCFCEIANIIILTISALNLSVDTKAAEEFFKTASSANVNAVFIIVVTGCGKNNKRDIDDETLINFTPLNNFFNMMRSCGVNLLLPPQGLGCCFQISSKSGRGIDELRQVLCEIGSKKSFSCPIQ